MNLISLKLNQYRNYASASFSFDPSTIHVLYGTNAQGKTNLIEAIYYLSHLRSFRTSKQESLIMHDKDFFALDARIENGGRFEELRVMAEPHKKYLYRHKKPVATASRFVGRINAVLFCPDDLSLFSLSPKNRRQFMDMELVKLSQKYTEVLARYNRLLKERNNLLKQPKVSRILADTYTRQMVDDEMIIIAQRHQFLKALEEQANKILPAVSNGNEHLTIRYKTFVDPDGDLQKLMDEQYEKTWKRDLQYKTTSAGIHKDDIEFVLNDRVLNQTASQGQKRSALLAIKLGLAQMIYEKTGQFPVLLLDDAFSELDEYRKKELIAALPKEAQVFISTAEFLNPEWFQREVKYYTVCDGKMKEGVFDV